MNIRARYAQSGTASAPAPGASDRRGGIAAGLNFLSWSAKRIEPPRFEEEWRMGWNTFRIVQHRLAMCLALVAMHSVPDALSQTSQWHADKNVEIVVGASPGGSGDSTARLLQKVFKDERLVNASTTVVNKAGGGGTISRIYLNQHAGDGHYLAIAPFNILTNYITGVSQQSYTDVTPLAHLFDEYIAFAVRADSPIRTGRDLAEHLKRNPESITIAIATTLIWLNSVNRHEQFRTPG